MQEFRFLYSARRIMLIDINMKVLDGILNRFQVTDFVMDKVPREITQKYKYKSYSSCALHVD